MIDCSQQVDNFLEQGENLPEGFSFFQSLSLKKADPRLKVVSVVAWSFLLALSPSKGSALAGLAGSLILIALSGVPLREVFKRVLAINFFIIFLWLALPFSFSVPGEVVATWGSLKVTAPGLALAWLLTIKGNAVALGAVAFFGASTVYEVGGAARKLGVPEKMTAIFIMMFRYVKVIGQEYERLRLAMKVRGFKPGLDLHSFRSLANLIGVLLVRSLDRADRVHAAMRCRGYNGRFWLTDEFHFGKSDWMLATLVLILMGGVIGFGFI